MVSSVARQRLGEWARGWLVAGSTLGLAIGGLWLTGGLEPSGPPPANARVGELIELTRWQITVTGCQIVPRAYSDQENLQILLEVTNTWYASQTEPNTNAIRVTLPNGEVFGAGGEYLYVVDPERGGDFDPGFTRPATAIGTLTQPMWSDPSAKVVLELGTEAEVDSYLSGKRWNGERTVAILELDCPRVAS